MSEGGERQAIISGIGQSAVGRRLGRSGIDLTMDSCLEAVADSGLTTADIDGLSCYPGGFMDSFEPGFGGPGTPDLQDALRLDLNWHSGGPEGPGQIAAVFNACAAIASGLARHVLVYRTVWESTAQGQGGSKGVGGGLHERVGGAHQYLMPFGAISAAHFLAMNTQRHFFEYGTTREHLGQIAVTTRHHASLNPKAIYRDEMTLDQYLASRMITTPLCLFDCDVVADGSTAFVVSHRDYAPDAPKPAIHVNAIGTALHGRPSWDQRPDMTVSAMKDAADMMWSRTDLRPADIDTAQLYDGFSILVLLNLEALGFCGIGESGPFVEGGRRIALDGELPLNTSGGQLSAGRLHGFGFLHEACVQLRGEGGERQVSGTPEVAAVANGGGPIAGTMLVTRGVR